MKSTMRTINNKYKICFTKKTLVTTPLYISFLDNDMKIKFIKNIRISTINMGAEVNINLCMKIDHGCSLYASKLEWPSNVNNAKKQTMGNSIKSKTIFFHLFFCSMYFPLRKCNSRFANLDRKLHVESCILTFSSDDYLAHSISLISFVVNLAKEACLGRYCLIKALACSI